MRSFFFQKISHPLQKIKNCDYLQYNGNKKSVQYKNKVRAIECKKCDKRVEQINKSEKNVSNDMNEKILI